MDDGLGGVTYEVDLSDTNATSLREALADYVAHARRQRGAMRDRNGAAGSVAAGPRRTGGDTRAVGTTATIDREQNRAIRGWSRKNGLSHSDRGRIPNTVSEAFHRGDPSGLQITASPTAGVAPAPTSLMAPRSTGEEKTGPDGLTNTEREHIRAWAQNAGIEVKTRGRPTKDLIANYRATHTRA